MPCDDDGARACDWSGWQIVRLTAAQVQMSTGSQAHRAEVPSTGVMRPAAYANRSGIPCSPVATGAMN